MRRLAFVVALLALVITGCGDKDASRFLDAIVRGDYDAANAELHPKARAATPNAASLRAMFESSGVQLVDFTAGCSVRGSGEKRVGYGYTIKHRPGMQQRPISVGVPPARRGSCNRSLVVELAEDGETWRVIGMRFD